MFSIVLLTIGLYFVEQAEPRSTPTLHEGADDIDQAIQVISPPESQLAVAKPIDDVTSTEPPSPVAHFSYDRESIVPYRARQHLMGGDPAVGPEPLDVVYVNNVEAAQSGDANAMYLVSKTLRSCASVLRSDEQHAAMLERYPLVAEQLTAEYEHTRAVCRPLWAVLPEDMDLVHASKTWLQRAADGGKQSALLETELGALADRSDESLASLESLVVRAAAEDSYQAFYMTADYVRERSNSEFAYEAWHLLACEEDPNCFEELHQMDLEWRLLPEDVSAVRRYSQTLREAIAENRLHDALMDVPDVHLTNLPR